MKSSANTLGIFVFTAIAITAFTLMAKRPTAEGNILQFGMPLKSTAIAQEDVTTKEKPQLVDEKPVEELIKVEEAEEKEIESDDAVDTSVESVEIESKK